jgi:hypothetical protein
MAVSFTRRLPHPNVFTNGDDPEQAQIAGQGEASLARTHERGLVSVL